MKDTIEDFGEFTDLLATAERKILEGFIEEATVALRNEKKYRDKISINGDGVPHEVWVDFKANGKDSLNNDIALIWRKISSILTWMRFTKKHENQAVEILKLLELPFGKAYDDLENLPPIDFITLMYIIAKVDLKAQKKSRNYLAKVAANARIAKDPKQLKLLAIEKEFINCNYPFQKRGYKAKFAREMHNKYPEIESIKTIEKLITKLAKIYNSAS